MEHTQTQQRSWKCRSGGVKKLCVVGGQTRNREHEKLFLFRALTDNNFIYKARRQLYRKVSVEITYKMKCN